MLLRPPFENLYLRAVGLRQVSGPLRLPPAVFETFLSAPWDPSPDQQRTTPLDVAVEQEAQQRPEVVRLMSHPGVGPIRSKTTRVWYSCN